MIIVSINKLEIDVGSQRIGAGNGIRKIIQELKNYEGVNPLSVPGSGLFCINKRWAWSVMPSRVFKTLRGQNSNENLQLQEIQFEGVVALSQNLSI